jgi:hypothetical protein
LKIGDDNARADPAAPLLGAPPALHCVSQAELVIGGTFDDFC